MDKQEWTDPRYEFLVDAWRDEQLGPDLVENWQAQHGSGAIRPVRAFIVPQPD